MIHVAMIFAIFSSFAFGSEPFECERGSNFHGRVYALSLGSYKSGRDALKDVDRVKMTVKIAIDKKKGFLTDMKLVVIEDTRNSSFHLVDSTCYTNRAPLGEASSMAYIFKNKYNLDTSYFEVYGKKDFTLYSSCED